MTSSSFLKSGLGSALLLAFLGALLYFPSFAADELDDEEGRRALPAREMVESGDFVVPTLWGEPYLSKPPLYFWLVAAASTLTDGVNTASTRLPSVLATILTALLVWWFGKRLAGATTGLTAGALFLVTFSVIEKGSFGELEAVFTLTLFASIAALYSASQGSRLALLFTALVLGAALLTKGPPAFVFFGAAAIAIAISKGEVSFLWSPKLWLPVVVAVALSGTWTYLLLVRPEVEDAMSKWGEQMSRGGLTDFAKYLKQRMSFVGSVFAGFFPPILIALLALRTDLGRRVFKEPAVRFCLVALALGLLFFLVMPGTQSRYVHPLLPLAALVAGRLLAAELESTDPRFKPRLAGLGRFVAFLGFAAASGAVWLLFRPIGNFDHLGPVGHTLAAVVFGTAFVAWRAWSRPTSSRALWATFGVLALLRLIQIGEIVPQAVGRQGRLHRAAEISAPVPASEPIYLGTDHHYNLLFYVERRLDRIHDLRETPVGGYLLVREEQLDELRTEPALPFESLLSTETHEGNRLVLVRISSP